MSAKYEKALRRRTVLYAAGAVLSLALVCLGFAMRLLFPHQSPEYHFAWQMFATLCGAVLLGPCLGGIHRAYRARRRGREAEIEETDERSRHIDALAWAASGRLTLAALTATMLISLTLMQFAVFWTCYWAVILERAAYLCFRQWFNSCL